MACLSPGKAPCPPHTHLGAVCPGIPVQGPVGAIVTVGHLVGCHVLDVPKVTGSLCDDACHLLLVPEVNLEETRLITASCRSSAPTLWHPPCSRGSQEELALMEKTPLGHHANARQIIKYDCEIFDPSTLTASLKSTKSGGKPISAPLPTPAISTFFARNISVGRTAKNLDSKKKYRIHRGNAFPLENNSG